MMIRPEALHLNTYVVGVQVNKLRPECSNPEEGRVAPQKRIKHLNTVATHELLNPLWPPLSGFCFRQSILNVRCV